MTKKIAKKTALSEWYEFEYGPDKVLISEAARAEIMRLRLENELLRIENASLKYERRRGRPAKLTIRDIFGNPAKEDSPKQKRGGGRMQRNSPKDKKEIIASVDRIKKKNELKTDTEFARYYIGKHPDSKSLRQDKRDRLEESVFAQLKYIREKTGCRRWKQKRTKK